MPKRFWSELTSAEFAALDTERTIAVLPLAAIEQHGAHLAIATDAVIADGLLALTAAGCPEDLPILILPTQSIGASSEHTAFAGTLSLSATTALAVWLEIVDAIARTPVRKLVLVSSHGGNSEVASLVAREARARHGMACVATSWRRFGLPEGLFTEAEATYGIHAGAVETSLMLYLRPDLVDTAKLADNPSADAGMPATYTHLRMAGPHALSWMIDDLNATGAVGDATAACAEKGRGVAEHQVAGFLGLLRDVERLRVGYAALRGT